MLACTAVAAGIGSVGNSNAIWQRSTDMMIVSTSPAQIAAIAYLLIAVGLVGSVVPLLPGPILIWVGALIWAWNDGFQTIGWPTLAVLGLLVLVGWCLDLVLTATISRRAGASWRSVAGAIVLGFVGGALGSGLAPVVGSLFGAAIGAVTGMIIVEYLVKRHWRPALRSSSGYLAGCALSKAAEAVLAVSMVAIFAWQAFISPI